MKKPLGEARRLRYFSFICNRLMEHKTVDQNIFIDMIIKDVKDLNIFLTEHKRSTGIMHTDRVAYNYITYLNWLGLIKRDSRFIQITTLGIYYANLYNKNTFKLSKREKISFFKLMLKKKKFKDFILLLKSSNTPKDIINIDYSEHIVETFLEWCFDLDILHVDAQSRGSFYYNKEFEKIKIMIKNDAELIEIFRVYCSIIYEKHIQIKQSFDVERIWKLIGVAIQKIGDQINSDFDPFLFSAGPLLLFVQLELIEDYNIIVEIENLISLLEKSAHEKQIQFGWDYLSNDGYLRLKRV